MNHSEKDDTLDAAQIHESSREACFRAKIIADLKSKETWKLKGVYFCLLSGIVILWAQLTIHQTSLNLSDRDVADFTSVSAVLTMGSTFIFGVIADKIGNFSKFVSTLMVLMGINAIFFTLIPPVSIKSSGCDENSTLINILTSITSENMDLTDLFNNYKVFSNLTSLKHDMTSLRHDCLLKKYILQNQMDYDIDKNVKLTDLEIDKNDNLTNLNVDKNVKLTNLEIDKNDKLTKYETLKNQTDSDIRYSYLSNLNCTEILNPVDLRDLKNSLFEYVVKSKTEDICNKTKEVDKYSYDLTYWSYMVVRTSFMLFTGASFTLFDGAVMAMKKEKNVDYGLQRAWGTLAALLSSYAGGFLVDFYSEGKETKDFTMMFYGSGLCCIIAGLLMFSVSINFKPPATNFSREFLRDICNFEALALMAIFVLKGLFMSYAETFMYIFMFKLGSTSSLIGLTVTVGASFEILLQFLATPITKSLGKVFVIAFGVFLMAVRFLGFSYTYDPRVIVALEIFDSWASGLTFTASNMYCSNFASTKTIASIRGLLGALHDGVGKFLGAKVGIEIKEYFGDRNAWRVMAAWALLSSVAYGLALAIYKGYAIKSRRRKKYTINSSQKKLHDV